MNGVGSGSIFDLQFLGLETQIAEKEIRISFGGPGITLRNMVCVLA
jgi:hypothetical protein